MTKIIPLITVLVLYAAGVKAQADTAALREIITMLDMAHAKAIFEGDSAALDRLMDDNITVNHPTNRIVNEKKELLGMISRGIIRYTSFQRFPEKLLFFNDMVIVMGRETVVPAAGAPNAGITLQRRYTNVWMKKDGSWKLTVRHANNVCT